MQRELCAIAAVVGLALGSGCSRSPEGPVEPIATATLADSLPVVEGGNVIIVSFDALRADALGAYGFDRAVSPNLDAFAEESLVFERAYSAAPVTPTSFAGAFTGRLPMNAFRGWKLVEENTIATAFSAAGYRTAGLFNNIQVTAERFFDRGFDHYVVYESAPDTEVLEAAEAWLGEQRDGKIFAWFHFIDPHAPYVARERSEHLYTPGYDGPFEETTGGKFEAERPEDANRIRELYDGEILAADELFGRLMSALESLGLLDKTIVVVTADHGEEFLERGVFQHRHLHDETTRIPMIVRHPGLTTPERTAIPVTNMDLLPTLTSLVGIAGHEGTFGQSWRGALPSPRPIPSIAMTDSEYRAVNLNYGDLRLIVTCMPERTRELFDLSTDPGEVNDLAPARSELTSELYDRLRAALGTEDPCREMQRAVRGVDPTEGLRPESIKELEALGYL